MNKEKQQQTTTGDQPLFLSSEMLNVFSFQNYRKTGITRARLLSPEDFNQRQGIINTLEGPSSFRVGDYLAVGVQGEEYPISPQTMARTKSLITPADQNGWATYATTTIVRAVQIPHSFSIRRSETNDINTGKAGDYLVVAGKRQFIVDQHIFLHTYTPIEKTPEMILSLLLPAVNLFLSRHAHLT